MRMKSILASLALAGLALPALCAAGRPETVTLTAPDGPPPSASPAPDQEAVEDAPASIGTAKGADTPPALPAPSPAGEGRAGAVPDPSAAVAQDGPGEGAAVTPDPPQSSLRRFLSAIVQFAASAATAR